MFGQSLLSAFGIACTTDTDQLFTEELQAKTAATLQLNNNVTATDISGYIGGGAFFNSSRNGAITLPAGITTPWSNSNEFGVSCWINPSTWGSGQQTMAFYFNGTNGGNIGFDREPSGNFRCFVTQSNGTFVGVNSSNNIATTNVWYHIVFTGSASAGVKLYVNGVNTGSASWDGTYTNGGGSNYIGVSPQSFRGIIDQFRVYSSYLTPTNVTALYAETSTTASNVNYQGTGVALYQLNGNAVDTSGNYSGATNSDVVYAYNGTAVNPAYTTGKFGQAYDFSANGTGTVATGTSSYITFADDMSRANNFSWSFWIKSTGTPSNYPTLVSFYGAYINYIYFSPNIATMYLAFSDGADTTFSTGLTSLSNWTHFAFTKSSTSGRKFYINGTSVFSDNTTANAGAAPRTGHAIGMHWASQGDWRYPLNGDTKIDQFRLFDESLDQDAVTALYNETATTATYNYIDYIQGNSIAYYKMENATDQLGNYNGTATGVNFNTTGKFGFAAGFSGGSDKIDISQALLGSGSTKIFSISFWFKTSSTTEQYLINTAAASSNSGFGIFINPTNGYLRYQTSTGSSFAPYLSLEDRSVQDGNWHHVVATYSSAGGTNDAYMYLYLDNQDVTGLCTPKNSWTQGGGATWSSFTVPRILFGNWADTSSYPGGLFPLIGDIDQTRIFNTALTATEVNTLYNEVEC